MPQEKISQLKLVSIGTIPIRTASGSTKVSYYNGIVSVEKTHLKGLKSVILQTPRPILGRTLLNLGSWLYDGIQSQWCLLNPASL